MQHLSFLFVNLYVVGYLTIMETADKFYSNAEKYWNEVPATMDGVLGGFSAISTIDIEGSKDFIRSFIKGKKAQTRTHCALDCGAGIGRISKDLLLPLFQHVDLVELNKGFFDEAKNYIGEDSKRVDSYINCGLQNFTPEDGRYDVIWCQWVLSHLQDDDLIEFFKRCKMGLSNHGIIVVKENVSSSGHIDLDDVDSSITRPQGVLLELIKKAGLRVVKEKKQTRFPQELYDVYMFAIQ